MQASPDFSFLTGTWRAGIWDGTFVEHWSAAANGIYQGMGRHEQGSNVGFMEFMSIEPEGESWTMFLVLGLPSQGLKTPMAFTLKSFDSGFVEFINERNAFPRTIVYRVVDEKTLECVLEPGPQSSEERAIFHFEKVLH